MATRKEQQQNTLVNQDAPADQAPAVEATSADTMLAEIKPTTSFEKAMHRAIRGARNSINGLLDRRQIAFPPSYNVANAMNAAALAIQRTTDMNKRPALQVCTEASIQEALFDMALMGLNPAKKQGYFIVYQDKLTWQSSYRGEVAMAMRVRPGIKVTGQIIYKGDEVVTEIVDGEARITKHLQKWADKQAGEIAGAYATLKDEFGRVESVVLMSWREIQNSWKQSKTYKSDGNGVHNRFPEAMAMRTVIRKLVSPIISQSDDSYLMEAVRRQDTAGIASDFAERRALNANQDVIRFSDEEDDADVVIETSVKYADEVPIVVEEETGEIVPDLPDLDLPDAPDDDEDDWKD